MLVELERRAAVHARRLEHGAPAQHAFVVGMEKRRVDGHDAAAELGERDERHATGAASGAPIAARSGRALTHDSSTSSAGSESQTMPPPTQRWIAPSATANVRIVSARSTSPFEWIRPSAPIAAPRPTGSSAAIRSSAAIFGQPVTDPPGQHGLEQLGQPDVFPQLSLDRRDKMRDACELALGEQLRPANGPRLGDTREIVPLEIDDHHVLGRVLRRLDRHARRARALDRRRADARAATREQELGRRGDDRPAVAFERLRLERSQTGKRAGKRRGIAVELGAQMLHEVHLIHVAFGDCRTHDVDRFRIVALAPRRVPLADGIRARRTARRLERVRDSGQAARLGRSRRSRPAQRIGCAVADEDARDRVLAGEEAVGSERRLELGERVELDRHPPIVCATCRSQSTPSSRSEAGTRSSAEWISVAASSGAIVRYGKKP